MLLRIWKTKARPERSAELERFMRKTAIPTLKKTKGCIYAACAKSSHSDPPQLIFLSIWKDLKSLKGFTGTNWQEPVVADEEAPLVLGVPEVEHYTLISKTS